MGIEPCFVTGSQAYTQKAKKERDLEKKTLRNRTSHCKGKERGEGGELIVKGNTMGQFKLRKVKGRGTSQRKPLLLAKTWRSFLTKKKDQKRELKKGVSLGTRGIRVSRDKVSTRVKNSLIGRAKKGRRSRNQGKVNDNLTVFMLGGGIRSGGGKPAKAREGKGQGIGKANFQSANKFSIFAGISKTAQRSGERQVERLEEEGASYSTAQEACEEFLQVQRRRGGCASQTFASESLDKLGTNGGTERTP